jgi:hypothetical protein
MQRQTWEHYSFCMGHDILQQYEMATMGSSSLIEAHFTHEHLGRRRRHSSVLCTFVVVGRGGLPLPAPRNEESTHIDDRREART